ERLRYRLKTPATGAQQGSLSLWSRSVLIFREMGEDKREREIY
ncbi:unnamed protein product, partial [Brassica rapa subsp. trilocularis]